MASTETMTYQDNLNSQYLSSSLSSLSNSRSTNSLIVRAYKQSTQLYLTKRFKDALETLEPIISTQDSAANGDATNDESAPAPAPIAQSSKGTRTKVWVFYLSLLHAIVDLGQEEGRNIFGSSKWRALANKAHEGTVWDEVVQCGYGGHEGDVDADVVVNLTTLLLGHMQSQRLNQQRVETYLATSDGNPSNGHLSLMPDGMSTPMSQSSSSPKLLATRLKILELYALHILPANEEWQYAETFVEMNGMLDEERKEAFMHALQQLKDEKDGTTQREHELKEQREKEMQEERRKQEENRLREQVRKEEEERHARAAEAEKAKITRMKSSSGPTGTPAPAAPPKPTPSSSSTRHTNKAAKKPPRSPPPSTFYHRASSLLTNLPQMVLQAGRNLNLNSMALLRMLMFVVAFLLILARRDLRVKVQRVVDEGWVKVKRTIGMGVKVSYV